MGRPYMDRLAFSPGNSHRLPIQRHSSHADRISNPATHGNPDTHAGGLHGDPGADPTSSNAFYAAAKAVNFQHLSAALLL